ncbi:hypothetical protein B0H19DRAFT_1146215 [Mycena capillaripes]|nr:hypothetical protein B0H19DRAFT_1146215 [Mycena capillaripes]
MLAAFLHPSLATCAFSSGFANFIAAGSVTFILISPSFIIRSSTHLEFSYIMNRRFFALFLLLFATLAVVAVPINVGEDVYL